MKRNTEIGFCTKPSREEGMKSGDVSLGYRYGLTRRQFMWLTGITAAGAAAGCATNPVTGESQLMMVSEEEEIQMDRQYSPMQFSSDYGATQDSALNAYVNQVGKAMTPRTHRTQMPYSFRVVNATYVTPTPSRAAVLPAPGAFS